MRTRSSGYVLLATMSVPTNAASISNSTSISTISSSSSALDTVSTTTPSTHNLPSVSEPNTYSRKTVPSSYYTRSQQKRYRHRQKLQQDFEKQYRVFIGSVETAVPAVPVSIPVPDPIPVPATAQDPDLDLALLSEHRSIQTNMPERPPHLSFDDHPEVISSDQDYFPFPIPFPPPPTIAMHDSSTPIKFLLAKHTLSENIKSQAEQYCNNANTVSLPSPGFLPLWMTMRAAELSSVIDAVVHHVQIGNIVIPPNLSYDDIDRFYNVQSWQSFNEIIECFDRRFLRMSSISAAFSTCNLCPPFSLIEKSQRLPPTTHCTQDGFGTLCTTHAWLCVLRNGDGSSTNIHI